MANNDIVPLPLPASMNSGLTSPNPQKLVDKFGVPGPANNGGISSVTSHLLKSHLVETTIEGMHVQLLAPVAASLRAVFKSVQDANREELLSGLKSAGTLVLRGQHSTHGFVWSLHSFGIAIDLYYGSDPIDQGDLHTYQGILDLYSFFHQQGFFWGAGYQTAARRDSMHFEMSKQRLAQILPTLH